MASNKPKPPISDWIVRERKRMGWKVPDLSKRLLDLGYDAQVSTVQVWEAGRSPRPETITALERLFGSAAPREVAGANPDYLAVLTRIADAVERMQVAQEETAAHLAAILGAAEHPRRAGTPAEGAGEARADIR